MHNYGEIGSAHTLSTGAIAPPSTGDAGLASN
jgi:hypothetical protein